MWGSRDGGFGSSQLNIRQPVTVQGSSAADFQLGCSEAMKHGDSTDMKLNLALRQLAMKYEALERENEYLRMENQQFRYAFENSLPPDVIMPRHFHEQRPMSSSTSSSHRLFYNQSLSSDLSNLPPRLVSARQPRNMVPDLRNTSYGPRIGAGPRPPPFNSDIQSSHLRQITPLRCPCDICFSGGGTSSQPMWSELPSSQRALLTISPRSMCLDPRSRAPRSLRYVPVAGPPTVPLSLPMPGMKQGVLHWPTSISHPVTVNTVSVCDPPVVHCTLPASGNVHSVQQKPHGVGLSHHPSPRDTTPSVCPPAQPTVTHDRGLYCHPVYQADIPVSYCRPPQHAAVVNDAGFHHRALPSPVHYRDRAASNHPPQHPIISHETGIPCRPIPSLEPVYCKVSEVSNLSPQHMAVPNNVSQHPSPSLVPYRHRTQLHLSQCCEPSLYSMPRLPHTVEAGGRYGDGRAVDAVGHYVSRTVVDMVGEKRVDAHKGTEYKKVVADRELYAYQSVGTETTYFIPRTEHHMHIPSDSDIPHSSLVHRLPPADLWHKSTTARNLHLPLDYSESHLSSSLQSDNKMESVSTSGRINCGDAAWNSNLSLLGNQSVAVAMGSVDDSPNSHSTDGSGTFSGRVDGEEIDILAKATEGLFSPDDGEQFMTDDEVETEQMFENSRMHESLMEHSYEDRLSHWQVFATENVPVDQSGRPECVPVDQSIYSKDFSSDQSRFSEPSYMSLIDNGSYVEHVQQSSKEFYAAVACTKAEPHKRDAVLRSSEDIARTCANSKNILPENVSRESMDVGERQLANFGKVSAARESLLASLVMDDGTWQQDEGPGKNKGDVGSTCLLESSTNDINICHVTRDINSHSYSKEKSDLVSSTVAAGDLSYKITFAESDLYDMVDRVEKMDCSAEQIKSLSSAAGQMRLGKRPVFSVGATDTGAKSQKLSVSASGDVSSADQGIVYHVPETDSGSEQANSENNEPLGSGHFPLTTLSSCTAQSKLILPPNSSCPEQENVFTECQIERDEKFNGDNCSTNNTAHTPAWSSSAVTNTSTQVTTIQSTRPVTAAQTTKPLTLAVVSGTTAQLSQSMITTTPLACQVTTTMQLVNTVTTTDVPVKTTKTPLLSSVKTSNTQVTSAQSTSSLTNTRPPLLSVTTTITTVTTTKSSSSLTTTATLQCHITTNKTSATTAQSAHSLTATAALPTTTPPLSRITTSNTQVTRTQLAASVTSIITSVPLPHFVTAANTQETATQSVYSLAIMALRPCSVIINKIPVTTKVVTTKPLPCPVTTKMSPVATAIAQVTTKQSATSAATTTLLPCFVTTTNAPLSTVQSFHPVVTMTPLPCPVTTKISPETNVRNTSTEATSLQSADSVTATSPILFPVTAANSAVTTTHSFHPVVTTKPLPCPVTTKTSTVTNASTKAAAMQLANAVTTTAPPVCPVTTINASVTTTQSFHQVVTTKPRPCPVTTETPLVTNISTRATTTKSASSVATTTLLPCSVTTTSVPITATQTFHPVVTSKSLSCPVTNITTKATSVQSADSVTTTSSLQFPVTTTDTKVTTTQSSQPVVTTTPLSCPVTTKTSPMFHPVVTSKSLSCPVTTKTSPVTTTNTRVTSLQSVSSETTTTTVPLCHMTAANLQVKTTWSLYSPTTATTKTPPYFHATTTVSATDTQASAVQSPSSVTTNTPPLCLVTTANAQVTTTQLSQPVITKTPLPCPAATTAPRVSFVTTANAQDTSAQSTTSVTTLLVHPVTTTNSQITTMQSVITTMPTHCPVTTTTLSLSFVTAINAPITSALSLLSVTTPVVCTITTTVMTDSVPVTSTQSTSCVMTTMPSQSPVATANSLATPAQPVSPLRNAKTTTSQHCPMTATDTQVSVTQPVASFAPTTPLLCPVTVAITSMMTVMSVSPMTTVSTASTEPLCTELVTRTSKTHVQTLSLSGIIDNLPEGRQQNVRSRNCFDFLMGLTSQQSPAQRQQCNSAVNGFKSTASFAHGNSCDNKQTGTALQQSNQLSSSPPRSLQHLPGDDLPQNSFSGNLSSHSPSSLSMVLDEKAK